MRIVKPDLPLNQIHFSTLNSINYICAKINVSVQSNDLEAESGVALALVKQCKVLAPCMIMGVD